MQTPQPSTAPLRIGIVAGEMSGDLLGAGLIRAIHEHHPDAVVEGIGGPQMLAAGCHSLFPLEELSVMGLVEVLVHLPRLLRIRREIVRHFFANPPDVFVGIDAPDFNLGVEQRLKRSGIPTVHYVSPSVWAWRRGRVRKIARSVDRMLALFPFEAEFYREHAVPVSFVGHPLADMIPERVAADAARATLGLPTDVPLVALLPGSRAGEVARLAERFVGTMAWCVRHRPGIHFVVPLANATTRAIFVTALDRQGGELPVQLIDGNARQVMAASDAVLLASGTATLEALLLKRPMVVAYRLAPLTYWLARRLVKLPHFALPNLLAGRALVPEFLQDDVLPEILGEAVLQCLDDSATRTRLITAFDELHHALRRDADRSAAAAVLEVAGR
ncbi:MAG: lipid-A-disaccharide synthase [Gammaproteobacteria bacterium]|nr:lipid-A-disaccharide synthase [Gammaproteobacteria bacterium]